MDCDILIATLFSTPLGTIISWGGKQQHGKFQSEQTSILSLWFNEKLEVRLDKGEPLLDTAFDVTTTLGHVS